MPELQSEQTQSKKPLIDFDRWSELAQSDPQAFEDKRSEIIEELIRNLPPHKQQRMRCLQWKIDQVRERANTPMAACIKISEMMWDSLVGPGGLREVLEQLGTQPAEPLRRAEVLELRPQR